MLLLVLTITTAEPCNDETPITVEPIGITTTIATATTKYPHGLTRGDSLTIRGSKDAAYNGTFEIQCG